MLLLSSVSMESSSFLLSSFPISEKVEGAQGVLRRHSWDSCDQEDMPDHMASFLAYKAGEERGEGIWSDGICFLQ